MNGRKQKATVSSATLWQRRNTAILVTAAPSNRRRQEGHRVITELLQKKYFGKDFKSAFPIWLRVLIQR